MTLGGTVNRSAMLLALVLISAGWTWNQFWTTHNAAAIAPYMWGGILGGLVVALVTVFKKTWAPVTAPVYALLEGQQRFDSLGTGGEELSLGIHFTFVSRAIT
jgi:uncharacterized YccA/Bax inhibitor family protein